MPELSPVEQALFDDLLLRRPDLEGCAPSLLPLHTAIVTSYDGGGKLLICGNGGSCADALHIAGELCKCFERKRPLDDAIKQKLRGLPLGDELAEHLEAGLPAIPLGANPALKSAIENDSPVRDIAYAQEVCALGKTGDVLLAISTSGNAANCLMALSAAKALGLTTASLTGPHGGRMALGADLAIRAPGDSTKTVQEAHLALYHTLCAMVEAHYFPEPR